MFTTFQANNVPLFVDGDQFYQPQHYGKIMGYDKLRLGLRWKEEDLQDDSETDFDAKKIKRE